MNAGADPECLKVLSASLGKSCKTVNGEDIKASPAEAIAEISSMLKDGKLAQNTSVVNFSDFESALGLAETMSVNGSLILKM